MSEEEKEAIEEVKRIIERYEHKPIGKISVELDEFDYNLFKTLLNLIETQQKEISLLKDQLEYVKSEYEETIDQQQKEIAQKDNIIDAIAEQLTTPVHNKQWVMDYFEGKVN